LSAFLPSYRKACIKAKYLNSVSDKLARVPAVRTDALKSWALEVLHMLSSLLIYRSYDAIYAVHVLESQVRWLRPSSLLLFFCMLHAARRAEPRTAEFHHEAENSKYFREGGRYFFFVVFVLSRCQRFILMIEKSGRNRCSFTLAPCSP
jgi:hypothetical protein